MALQELDLKIEYRPGSKNQKADALSCYPPPLVIDNSVGVLTSPVIAAIATNKVELILAERQRRDPYLMSLIAYLEDDVLPSDDRMAHELILGRSQYVLNDGVLYRVESDKVVVPEIDQERLFMEVHAGEFGGHLREAKIHSQLSHHYWWPSIRRNITGWCRACLTCASQNVGKPFKPFHPNTC